MAISGVYNDLDSMMTVQQSERRQSAPSGDMSSLSRLTDSISLSSVDPKLRSVLEDISEQGGNVLETLERNVDNLQDGFLNTLHEKMADAGITMQEKITLRLEGNDDVIVKGDHPDKDAIENILAENSELKNAFTEIATQSGLARDLRSIRNVVGNTGAAQYANMSQTGGQMNQNYQVSLKGPMSHFYFTNS